MRNFRPLLNTARRYYETLQEKSQYKKNHHRFRNYTMIKSVNYVNTLRLAKRSSAIEGCVVQCGVWKGGLAAGLVSVLGTKREYFLYDSFAGLPKAKEIDGSAAVEWQSNTQGPVYFDNCAASPDFAETAMKLAGAEKYHLVKGWFEQTLAQNKPNIPIAFLHLDADWYDSMTVCLEQLFDYVAVGGYIVIDDYYVWDGCSRALHDFLSHRSALERVHNLGEICYLEKV
jgi:O-methyltransferase